MSVYLPHDWPAEVLPPGSEDFESTAGGAAGHPAARLSQAPNAAPVSPSAGIYCPPSCTCLRGGRAAELPDCPLELGMALPPHAVDGVLAAYKKEGFALAATARAVELVERATKGETFAPKL